MKINLQDASLLRPSIAARMLLFQAELGLAGFTVRVRMKSCVSMQENKRERSKKRKA